ncbi:hypothetical protein OG474_08085 [Kribbella sp. NBC_01505]|uniref:hypothetical protein n=1 Tax=Kribbella sp. NBC_01505 TaxID=2903580 RepID=UPI00386415CD
MTKYLILMSEPDHYAQWNAADETTRDAYLADLATFTTAVRAHGTLHAVLPLLPTEPPTDLHGAYLVDLPDQTTAANLTKLLPSPCEIRECQDVGIPITA